MNRSAVLVGLSPEWDEKKAGTGFSPVSRSKLLESITFMTLDRFDPKSS
jgi:hypothetical protein